MQKASPEKFLMRLCKVKSRRRPTLPRVCSTIGAIGLNFSVRNGKRWNPDALTTGISIGQHLNFAGYVCLIIQGLLDILSAGTPQVAGRPQVSGY